MNLSQDADGVLEALRHQWADLSRAAEEARARVLEYEWKLDNLTEAIAALERMQSPVLEAPPAPPHIDQALSTDGRTKSRSSVRVWGSEEPLELTGFKDNLGSVEILHPAVAPYVGGTGQRLRSTAMVADLLASTDETFTRDELKSLFFTTYPREVLTKFWEKPDNAFGNALLRAVEEGLVAKGKRNGTTEVFMSRAAYNKIIDDLQKKGSSNPSAGGTDAS